MDQHVRTARPAVPAPIVLDPTDRDPDVLDRAADTLAAALADYPFTRHTLAADDHVGRVRRAQRVYLERIGLPHGRVWICDGADTGRVDAVAVWTTPATDLRLLAELAPLAREIAGDRAEASDAAERALQPHRPTDPVWFLATVGVRPDRQGSGLGRAVLEPGLRAADAEGVDCFLETSLEIERRLLPPAWLRRHRRGRPARRWSADLGDAPGGRRYCGRGPALL